MSYKIVSGGRVRRSTWRDKKINQGYDMKKLFSLLICIALTLVCFASCVSEGPAATDDKYFTFAEYGSGYVISANASEDYPKTLVLPSEHNGKKILAVADGGFKDCKNLEKVVIPFGYEKIGADAFAGLSKLHNVSIAAVNGEGEVSLEIGHSAFSDCVALTEVTFGKSVKKIGAYAFKSTRILRIEFSGVEEIGDYAFKDCTALTYVYVPQTLKASGVGLTPFNGVKNDVSFNIDENAKLNGITVELLVGKND